MNSRFAALSGWALAGLLTTTASAQDPSTAREAAAAKGAAPTAGARFDAPVELTAGGKPLRGILYPSPTLHDSDGDGKPELWVGDLPGHVMQAKPSAGSRGAFESLEKIRSRDNKLLKLQNW